MSLGLIFRIVCVSGLVASMSLAITARMSGDVVVQGETHEVRDIELVVPPDSELPYAVDIHMKGRSSERPGGSGSRRYFPVHLHVDGERMASVDMLGQTSKRRSGLHYNNRSTVEMELSPGDRLIASVRLDKGLGYDYMAVSVRSGVRHVPRGWLYGSLAAMLLGMVGAFAFRD